jgi:hypothetical protein
VLASACRTRHASVRDAPVRNRPTSATFQRQGCRCQRRINIGLEMASLQPAHEDPGKARHAPIRIALAPINMKASGQVLRIGSRQQPRECIETHRIECLHHSVTACRWPTRSTSIGAPLLQVHADRQQDRRSENNYMDVTPITLY